MNAHTVQVTTSIVLYIIIAFGAYMMGRRDEQKFWSTRLFELLRAETQAIKDKIILHGDKQKVMK